MVKNGQKWAKMVINDSFPYNWVQKSFKVIQNGQKWSKMVKNGPKWPKMVKNDPKWSKRVKTFEKTQKKREKSCFQKWGSKYR